jgi:hypothetical protein
MTRSTDADVAIPPEPEFDGSPESIQARKKWYIDKYLSRNGATLSQQELFSLPAPGPFGPAVTMADVDQAIADAMAPTNSVVKTFTDAECKAVIVESELPNWKETYYRGTFRAGQLVRLQTIPKGSPVAADMAEEFVFAYDKDGNRALEICMAVNGRPKDQFDGTSVVKKHYEGKTLRETRYYNAVLEQVENQYGVHRSLHRDDGIVLNYFKDGAIVDQWLDPLYLGKRINEKHG